MATDKKQHWQDVVFEPSGVTPGVYDRPVLTVNDFGFITAATTSTTPAQTIVNTIGDLPGIAAPTTGDLAIVLNIGGSEEEEMYVWNTTNPNLGAPFGKWRLLASTALATPPVDFVNEGIVNVTLIQALGAPIPITAKIKAVHVTIFTVYDLGTMITISEQGGSVWMAPGAINAQLPGVYTQDHSDNDANMSSAGQLQAQLSLASVGGGSGLVYVEYIIQ